MTCPSTFSLILSNFLLFRYHIYRQNQNRLNNNNTTRVNLNNIRPVAPQQQPQVDGDVPSQQPENNGENNSEEQPAESEVATQEEPPVPVLEVVKTFLVSFVASIIPTDPAF